MKTKIYFSLIIFSFLSICTSCAQIKTKKIKIPKNLPTIITTPKTAELTETDIINGLKEALTQGSKKASDSLNKTDGYNLNPKVRIPFPEDCQKVATRLREMGFGKKVDDFELKLNRSAEQAAKEASPIFIDAIKQMTFADAKSILKGADTAATGYLRKTTYSSLYGAFSPHITTALNSTMAAKSWTELTTIYNKLPTTKTKVETDLVRYTTHKALKGLFVLVADEELKIRKDPMARVTDILKKVFGNNN